MGSIADIAISLEAGRNIPDDENVISAANNRLVELVRKIDAEVEERLEALPS